MRVLVTGGAGFIGSHIVAVLRGDANGVIVLDDLSTGSTSNLPDDVTFVHHDLTATDTSELIERLRPDAIVHAAAQVSVSRSADDPAGDARTNVVGTVRLLEGARMAGTRTVVYVTTGGALYGEPRYLPCDEDHPIDPISPYGLSKWVGERYLPLLVPGARRVVLRLANVFGPRQNAEGEAGVVSIFASRMLSDSPVEIHGDGAQTRDFVYVEDVAAAVARSLGADRDLTLNIGSGTGLSVGELYALIRDLTGYTGRATYTAPRPADVRHSVLDVHRAHDAIGWSPRVDLRDGLERTLAWYRGAPSGTPAG
jgi:UDP-glucose 4-epimerase